MADDLAAQYEERMDLGSGRRGGGRSRGGRGGGRGGAGADSQLSRALSRLLRHQAENAGIKLDKEGFAPLARVVGLLSSVSDRL